MNRLKIRKGLVAALAAAAFASPAATWNAGDLTNELVVAAGETYTLTAEDAERLGSTCLHLMGEGTVVGTADFAAFTGSFRLSNGVYRHNEYGGLGATNATHVGALVIDGGTLETRQNVSNAWAVRDIPTVPVGLTVYLSGTGYQGKGAVVVANDTENFARTVVLAGDALIASPNAYATSLQFRYCDVKQGADAPKLTVTNVNFGLVQQWGGSDAVSGWDVTAKGGGDLFLSDSVLPFRDSTFRLTGYTCLRLWSFGGNSNSGTATSPYESDFHAALAFSDMSWIRVTYGCPALDAKGAGLRDDRNRFAGPVTLADGLHGIVFTKDGTGIAFDGVVSGDGGFRESTAADAKAGWLRLSNATNSFAGGVGVRGTAQDDGTFLGGLSLLASGAAPVDGGAVTLSNATLRLNGSQAYELPSIVVTDGGEILDTLAAKTSVSAKGLTKTGPGTLVLSSPVAFSELADVREGTVKLVVSGSALRGLKMWWRPTSAKSVSDVKQDAYYRGLDGDVSYAYRSWTNYGSGGNGDDSYCQGYRYEGDIRIPGEEGEDVTFNFISCLTRYCEVQIDGTTVAKVDDNYNRLSGGVYVGSWTRLGIAPRFTMKAGWHKIAVDMRNTWSAICGPVVAKVNGVEVWPANFGIGVDWQGRCTTNSADYAKLQDPGDGSFLRWTHDTTLTRARFGGGLAFAAGTAIDLGGASEALSVPSLAGSPTIRNGGLAVASNEWNLRVGDVAAGKPLAIESGSSLLFGEAGSTVTVTAEAGALAGLRGKIRLLSWASAAERPDNAFVASDDLKARGYSLQEDEDGLYLQRGFAVIIR